MSLCMESATSVQIFHEMTAAKTAMSTYAMKSTAVLTLRAIYGNSTSTRTWAPVRRA